MILDVRSYVEQEKEKLKDLRVPRRLHIIQVGDNAASNSYIRGKMRDCTELGVDVKLTKFGEKCDPIEVLAEISRSTGTGIIVQQPTGFDERDNKRIIEAIPREADVDGFRKDSPYLPCTPRGIMDGIKEFCGDIAGKVVVVIGRGPLVGAPIVPLLIAERATVISCNAATPNLKEMTQMADIIVSAVGERVIDDKSWVKDGVYIFDAGLHVGDDKKLAGDIAPEVIEDPNVWGTSTPGGVGLLTRLALMKNTSGR